MGTIVNGKTQISTIHVNRCDGTMSVLDLESNLYLTNTSYYWYIIACIGSIKTIFLPDATTLRPGWKIIIQNASSGNINLRVNYNDESTNIIDIQQGQIYEFICINTSTSNGLWYVSYMYTNTGSNTGILESAYLSNMIWR